MRPIRTIPTDTADATTNPWLPLEDRRDADGYTYAEHCDNVARVAAGQSPRPPHQPRVATASTVEPQQALAPALEVTRTPTVVAVKGVSAVAPRQRIRFLDDYQRRPRPKTRKKRIDRGAVYFTAIDRALMEEITAWGYLTYGDIGLLLGRDRSTISKRIKRLVKVGFLRLRHRGPDGSSVVITPTAKGMRAVGMGDGYKASSPSMTNWNHHSFGVAVAAYLRHNAPQMGVWMTEREVIAAHTLATRNADAVKRGENAPFEQVISPRILRLAPWTANWALDTPLKWAPHVYSAGGMVKSRRHPDGFLLVEGAAPRILELELTPKHRGRSPESGNYAEMKTTYLYGALDGVFDPVVLYFVSEAQRNGAQIQRTLDYARPANSDLQNHAKRIGFEVTIQTVPSRVWAPFGCPHGWVKPITSNTP